MIMSLSSRLALAGSCLISGSIIIYVHYKQEYDRGQMHYGVAKDMDRRRRRKIENTYILQQQAELTKELQKDFDNKNRESLGSSLPS